MKKLIILFLAVAGVTEISQAQFLTKGALIGTGSLGFETYKEKYEGSFTQEEKHTGFGLDASAAYFIMDNLGIGAALNFSNSKSVDETNDYEFTDSDITFGPVVRYYFADGPFAQGYFGFGSSTSKSDFGGSSTTESKNKVAEWLIGAGYSVRISDTVLLDPMLSYGSTKYTDKDDSANTRTLSGHFMIHVGFTIILIAP